MVRVHAVVRVKQHQAVVWHRECMQLCRCSGEAASTGSGECRTSLKYKHHPYSPWLLADMLFQIYILYLRKIYALVRLNCYILIVNIVFQLAVANVNFPMF